MTVDNHASLKHFIHVYKSMSQTSSFFYIKRRETANVREKETHGLCE